MSKELSEALAILLNMDVPKSKVGRKQGYAKRSQQSTESMDISLTPLAKRFVKTKPRGYVASVLQDLAEAAACEACDGSGYADYAAVACEVCNGTCFTN